MEVIKTLLSKTCFFVLKTTFDNDYVAQESGSGTSGHLMRWTPPNTTTFNDYYKFLIYPDPTSENEYRMVVVGWPELEVQLESNRARIVNKSDSDLQRFKFMIARPPAVEKDKNIEWYYLQGIGVKLHFDFASHRYVFPSSNPHDQAKLKFIAVDMVQPDATLVKAPIKLVDSEIAPPKNYTEVRGKEWGIKVISVDAIPAALIDDDDYRTKSDQVAMNPYYYLKHEKLWSSEQLDVITLSKNKKTKVDIGYTSAFKRSDYQSVEKTIGHTFSASLEIYGKKRDELSVGDEEGKASERKEIGASLKLAYQYQNQTKTVSQRTNSQETTIELRLTTEYRQLEPNEDDIFVKHWLLVDRYTLMNSKGGIKARWEYTGSNSPVPQEMSR